MLKTVANDTNFIEILTFMPTSNTLYTKKQSPYRKEFHMELKETVLDLGRMRWEATKDENGEILYLSKTLHEDEETGMLISYIRFPANCPSIYQKFNCDTWIYVLDGQLLTDNELYGKDTLIKYPEGIITKNGADEYDHAEVLLISSKEFKPETVDKAVATACTIKKEVQDVKGTPWFYRPTSTDGKLHGRKSLVLDEKTGIQINYMNYPAGFTTYRHTHTAGHAFLVLSGQLRSDENTYGPGTFIWYPEGQVAEHGATAYEDFICLQISNKSFSINYVK